MEGSAAVDVHAEPTVEFGELPVGLFPNQAIVADHLTHDRSIFLFHKTLVIFEIWASPCEDDLLLLAVCHQRLVDEFSPVVGIDSQDRKREQYACLLECCQHRFLTAV
jgi:hypothetical protein